MDDYTKYLKPSFVRLVNDFFIRNHKALSFLAGLTAYPIGQALITLIKP